MNRTNYDLIGYYGNPMDIVGANPYGLAIGQEQLVGPAAGYDASIQAAAAAQILARDSFLLNQRQPTVARVEFLGFGCVEVAPGETVCLKANPQVPCKADRLFVPRSQGDNFIIHSVKFGKWELFAGSCGAVPASIFAPDAEDTVFNSDTVGPGSEVSITIENIAATCQKFSAGMRVKAVE